MTQAKVSEAHIGTTPSSQTAALAGAQNDATRPALAEPATRPCVLVKAKGGMGNRLLCAMTGLAYADLADRRCIIDWTDNTYSNQGENAFPRFFACEGVDPLETLPDHGEIEPVIWSNHLDHSVSEMIHKYDPSRHSSVTIGRKYSLDPRRLDYRQNLLVYWSYTERFYALQRHLRHDDRWPASSDAALRHALQNRLRLHSAIQEKIDRFAEGHFAPKMIGLHLRCTDRTMKIERPLQIAKAIQARHPAAGLFVATDNRQVLSRLEAECHNVISTPKWYPDDGQAMHQNDSCPDRYENGVEALVDMWLLSQCDYLIYARRSTFSYVSALLSRAPEDQVYDVDRLNPKVKIKRLVRRIFE